MGKVERTAWEGVTLRWAWAALRQTNLYCGSLVDRKQLASFGVCIPATTVPGLGGRGGHRGEGGGGHACPYGHVYPKDTQGTQ